MLLNERFQLLLYYPDEMARVAIRRPLEVKVIWRRESVRMRESADSGGPGRRHKIERASTNYSPLSHDDDVVG